MNTEELVSVYITIRDERKKLLQEYEARDGELKQDLAKLEQALLAICNEVNASSVKTNVGTVMRQVNERYVCSDWGNFYAFLREHDAVELLERRIHQGNFKEFMAEHKLEGLPPGVNAMREYSVTVRRAPSSDVNN